jgi:hypothetical protein
LPVICSSCLVTSLTTADIGEAIRGNSEWKSSKAGVSGKGDERVEEGEGELVESSYGSMVKVSGDPGEGAKVGSPRVTEISRERVSRAVYSTRYAPGGSEYIGIEGW